MKEPNRTPLARLARLTLRRAAIRIAQIAIQIRSRPFEPGQLDAVLVVAPHPDDETFGCGGTLALMAAGGLNPSVVFVTDGGGSHPLHPTLSRAELSSRRKLEAMEALSTLGVGRERVTFIDAIDGTLSRLAGPRLTEVIDRIAALLARLRPAAIFLPARDDGSSEHDAAFIMVRLALEKAALKPRIFEYPIWSWWNPLRLVRPVFARGAIWRVVLGPAARLKASAIAAYTSQTHPIPPETSPSLPEGFALMFQRGDEFFLERREVK